VAVDADVDPMLGLLNDMPQGPGLEKTGVGIVDTLRDGLQQGGGLILFEGGGLQQFEHQHRIERDDACRLSR
jgi:hypothetical protein